mgnify:CR=1 FL=1
MLAVVVIVLFIGIPAYLVVGAIDRLTHGGLYKNKGWQITRKILWRNKS